MNALVSASGGLCALVDDDPIIVYDVFGDFKIPVEGTHFACSLVDDWEAVRRESREEILEVAKARTTISRMRLNIEECLLDRVSAHLKLLLLEEVEESLHLPKASTRLMSMLLEAPLKEAGRLSLLVATCLENGLVGSAAVLEQLGDCQVLLQRLADRWLALPDDLFSGLPAGRSGVWTMAATRGVVFRTLEATSPGSVEQLWATLVFEVTTLGERKSLARIARSLAGTMFPGAEADGLRLRAETDDLGRRVRRPKSRFTSPHMEFEKAIRQVGAIAVAVAEGQDARATRYLRDLLDAQVEIPGGEEHAAKSLCNVARQCAEMFRTDFEYECLQAAVAMSPSDHRAASQLADHYKRMGKFDHALGWLHKAEQLGAGVFAKCMKADVFVQLGKYDEALRMYGEIPGSEFDPVIRTARADALRRSGDLEAASLEYQRIIRDGLATHRIYAGMAEIAKRQGQLYAARSGYVSLLQEPSLDGQSSVIYKMALANVLVRMGELHGAYSLLDGVVQLRPFAMQARVNRAAVAGLLGNAEAAISDLSDEIKRDATLEWLRCYTRGLLLLVLDRFADARGALLLEADRRAVDQDLDAMRRLGAAVMLLRTRAGVEQAGEVLDSVPEFRDKFADSIRAALQYHVAVSLRRTDEMSRLRALIAEIEDPDVNAIVSAIGVGDWKRAWQIEVRTLLKLAA